MAPRVVIVGAGIGGLAAAHHLGELASERGLALEIRLLEASDRAGGALSTERFEGALLERGPDTLVTHKPAGLALVERLGLAPRLVAKPPGWIDVLHHGELLPLPEGFALLAPTAAQPLLSSALLSAAGKERALLEPNVPAKEGVDDESVAAFVRRRFGDEVYERLTEPVVGGLFMADCEQLSLAATFPRFAELERQRGSLLGAGPAPPRLPGAPPATVTLEGGMGQIVEALLLRLPKDALCLGVAVSALLRAEHGYRLALASGEWLAADALILALPAPSTASLLADMDARLAGQIGTTSYASCATVHLAWPRLALSRKPESLGFFVPRTAGSPLVAASFVSTKYPERVPEGLFVVRAFLGGALHEGALDRKDAEVIELAAAKLSSVLGATEPPTWSRLCRQPHSMPQRTVGHVDRMKGLTAHLEAHPGLELAGGPIGAYGLPDSIATGEEAARRVVEELALSARQSAVEHHPLKSSSRDLL